MGVEGEGKERQRPRWLCGNETPLGSALEKDTLHFRGTRKAAGAAALRGAGEACPGPAEFVLPYNVFSTFTAARTVASRSAAVCAAEMKPASNCDGAR